ncbi:MAG TPA: hypothetical protein VFB42_01150 [Gaiellaceae bacterium]|nr:hypothetical protein [Gaiellaceae bacterium]
MNRRTGIAAALILAAGAATGAGAGAARTPASARALHVGLTEWAVVPSQGLVAAGPLRITVRNYGRLAHELDVIPTRRWGQRLRVRHGRAVGTPVGAPVVVAPGRARAVELDLEPGSYVLLDNIRGHYSLGAAVSILAR